MAMESATLILDEVWSEIVGFIPKKEQRDMATKIVKIFEDNADFVAAEETEHPLLRKVSREMNDMDEDPDEDE
jgi:hypothetical protein